MEENIDDNIIVENSDDHENIEFKYSFIDTPWDDRSSKSKAGIIALLTAIFIGTMACVINNFDYHYRFGSVKKLSSSDISCHRVRMDDFRFAARIHSVSSQQLLCVGALVSSTSVLANGVCVQSGPIRVHLGSPTNPRCKKGFAVDIIEPVFHDGVVAKKLVLLSSYEFLAECAEAIGIGENLNWTAQVHIIGRPLNMEAFLSRQHVSLAGKELSNTGNAVKDLNKDSVICVKDLARCPVRAGDLLVQKDRLFGLAATSTHRTDRNKMTCFADLNVVRQVLTELDPEIDFENKKQKL